MRVNPSQSKQLIFKSHILQIAKVRPTSIMTIIIMDNSHCPSHNLISQKIEFYSSVFVCPWLLSFRLLSLLLSCMYRVVFVLCCWVPVPWTPSSWRRMFSRFGSSPPEVASARRQQVVRRQTSIHPISLESYSSKFASFSHISTL